MISRIIITTLFVLGCACTSWAGDVYVVDPKASTVKCSVRYSLIGQYVAHYKSFEGEIDYDPANIVNTQIAFKVKTASIQSKYPKLDRMVLSRRMLDAARYPEMTFQSVKIIFKDGQYFVTGTFNLHGVSKELTVPLKISGPLIDPKSKRQYLVGEEHWKINRKLFKIMWDKFLDRGGVVVGDTVNINWKIVAYKKE